MGKTGKSNQSEKFIIFTGSENRLSFKVVSVDSEGRSNLLRCCLNSMQNNVCWLLVCSKYAAATCEHGIVFPLKRMEIMLWHKASSLLVLGECFFSIKFQNQFYACIILLVIEGETLYHCLKTNVCCILASDF